MNSDERISVSNEPSNPAELEGNNLSNAVLRRRRDVVRRTLGQKGWLEMLRFLRDTVLIVLGAATCGAAQVSMQSSQGGGQARPGLLSEAWNSEDQLC